MNSKPTNDRHDAADAQNTAPANGPLDRPWTPGQPLTADTFINSTRFGRTSKVPQVIDGTESLSIASSSDTLAIRDIVERNSRLPVQFDWLTAELSTQLLDQSADQDASEFEDYLRRYQALRQHGSSSLAFATLQPGMSYFESRDGYLAFDKSMGVTFVLGDPVGPVENHGAMIGDFLASHRHVVFCQISQTTAEILSKRNWYLNEIGAESQLYLPKYDFEGPKKSKVNQAAQQIERQGYRIKELSNTQIDLRSLDSMYASWTATKKLHHEARFLVRPLNFGVEPDVRKFYLFDARDRLCALMAFDPIYLAGHVLGYTLSIKRRAPFSPVGADEAITKFAIEQFRSEGIQFLRLGLLPLYEVKKPKYRDIGPLRTLLQCVYRYGEQRLHHFQRQADFQSRFRGELTKLYLATDRFWGSSFRLMALSRACGFF